MSYNERSGDSAQTPSQPLTTHAEKDSDDMAGTKSSKAPAFQFYPTDFLGDPNVIVMSLAERGAYITLLCVCWQQKSLPSDRGKLARLCGVPPTTFQKLWPALEPCFKAATSQPDRIVHPRLDRERRKQNEYRRRQSDNGRLGGRPKKPNETQAFSVALPNESQPEASGFPNDKAKKSSSSLSLSSSSDFSQKERTPAKVTFDGNRLRVWHWQHEDLGKRLGAKISDFDLLGWYSRLETELAATGEAFADPWKWLQERLYRDAELPLPNLMGRRQPASEVEDVRSWCRHPNGCPNREYHENILRMEARNKANV